MDIPLINEKDFLWISADPNHENIISKYFMGRQLFWMSYVYNDYSFIYNLVYINVIIFAWLLKFPNNKRSIKVLGNLISLYTFVAEFTIAAENRSN